MTNKQAYAGLLERLVEAALAREAEIHFGTAASRMRTAKELDEAKAEAAEAISSLLKRVGELEGALRPFADHPDFHASDDWAVTKLDDGLDEVPGVTAGDFRRARAALNSDAPLSIGEEQ